MKIYAQRTDHHPRPEFLAAGCPASGWVHYARAPWRVIIWTDPTEVQHLIEHGRDMVEYDGDEATVHMDELKAMVKRRAAA